MNEEYLDIIESLTYESERDIYRATFDSTTVAPSKAVVAVVAAIEEEDAMQLVPLYNAVNADALDNLCSEQFPGRYDSDRLVQFTYQGYEIKVWSHGTITAGPNGATTTNREIS